MRVLKPEVAKEREETILRWIIQQFVETRRPVGSEMIARHALPDVSSATIRNVMKKLEDEGFLHQVHTSGGRIPTDKAYRFYVDYLAKVQKLAAQERNRIEREYEKNVEAVDKAMLQTSRMLAVLSRSAGFVFTGGIEEHFIQRLDFIPLGMGGILAVLVTDTGAVKHWPIRLNYAISPVKLRILSNFINHKISGLPLRDAQRVLKELIAQEHSEIGEMADLAIRVLRDMERTDQNSSELYLEGAAQLLENVDSSDYEEMRQMIRVIEEKQRLSGVMTERLQQMQRTPGGLEIVIGAENEIKELKNLSIVSSAYKVGDKTIGMLGIIGTKHMEYAKMAGLVNFMVELLEDTIDNWRKLTLDLEE